MSLSNGDPKPADNMDSQKQQASSCGGGCSCHSTGARVQKHMVLGVIMLCVAAALLVRAVVRTDATPIQPDAAAFAVPTATETVPAENTPATSAAAPVASNAERPGMDDPDHCGDLPGSWVYHGCLQFDSAAVVEAEYVEIAGQALGQSPADGSCGTGGRR